jgi:hypothetical protein
MSSLYFRTVAQGTVYGTGIARGISTWLVRDRILTCVFVEGKCGIMVYHQ